MANKTVEDLKEDVSAILTGIDLDDVPNPYGSFERAVATTIQKMDVLEASGREPIMLYDGVYDYQAPDTIFGAGLIDIRPQGVNRNRWDDTVKMPITRFDQTKCVTPSGYKVTFEDRAGNQIMRIAQNYANKRVTIDSMTSLDGWALGGNATGLALDSTVYYHQPASLRFNLTAAGTQATLTKTLDNALDLTDYEGVGVIFLAIYMPQTSGTVPSITSASVKLGSAAGAYYEATATEGFLGSFYVNDFFLIALDLAGVAATGAPDFGAVTFVEVLLDFNGTATPNVRVGDLFIALPSPHEVLFYSPAVFISGTNAPAESIDTDEDQIIFHTAAYSIYVQEAAREIAKNQGGEIGSGIIQAIDLVLEGNGDKKLGLYQQYRGDNPSEELRQIGNYYDEGGAGGYGTAGSLGW